MSKKKKPSVGINNKDLPEDFTQMKPEELPDLVTADTIDEPTGLTKGFKRQYGGDIMKMLKDAQAIEKETKRRLRVQKKLQNQKDDAIFADTMQSAKEEFLKKADAAGVVADIVKERLENKSNIVEVSVAKAAQADNVIFRPNPGPQTMFLASSEREVLYGGARGGGKTYALMVAPLRFCRHKDARALIVRRTMPELRDIIYKAQALYPKAFPGCKFNGKDNTFYFPSGARIEFGYADSRQDWMRYQGQSYTWIGIDEAAQFNELGEMLECFRGCLRSIDPLNLPTQLRLTANPGNVSADVLKREFIDKSPPDITFYEEVPLPDGTIEKISRKFIPAKVTDNPYLMQDKSYLTMLASLSPAKREMWLNGSWDVVEGAAFPEFDRGYHVVKPFAIPTDWQRVRGMDWGYTSPGCCLWGAFAPDGSLYIYRELYFQKKTAHEVAQRIRDMEINDRIHFGVLDVSAWARRGEVGPSIGETINNYNLRFRPSSRVMTQNKSSRKAGKVQIHNLLAINESTGKPKLFFFENCLNIIRTLPGLPISQVDPEDIDTDAEDHAYDALRYLIQSRAIAPSGWNADPFVAQNLATTVEQYQPVDELLGF